MGKRLPAPEMRVVPRFVFNPEKTERGLKAMADILALALQRASGPTTIPEE